MSAKCHSLGKETENERVQYIRARMTPQIDKQSGHRGIARDLMAVTKKVAFLT